MRRGVRKRARPLAPSVAFRFGGIYLEALVPFAEQVLHALAVEECPRDLREDDRARGAAWGRRRVSARPVADGWWVGRPFVRSISRARTCGAKRKPRTPKTAPPTRNPPKKELPPPARSELRHTADASRLRPTRPTAGRDAAPARPLEAAPSLAEWAFIATTFIFDSPPPRSYDGSSKRGYATRSAKRRRSPPSPPRVRRFPEGVSLPPISSLSFLPSRRGYTLT